MAVDVEFLPANSINNINTNFERVEEALQDVVGRSGTLPNEMTSDLDLDGNDILNGGTANFEDIYVDDVPINEIVGIQGIPGPTGPTGATGPQGEQGIQGPTGQGLDFDVQVDDLIARDAYDSEAEGFRVLVSDDGVGGAAIFSRVSATPGTWSDPAYIGTSSDAVLGPASSTTDNFLSFSNTSGKNAKDSGVPSAKVVRVDTSQSFSGGEQTQARTNIAALGASDITGKLDVDGANGDSDFFERLKWLSKGIGEYYWADSGETGVDIPPIDPADGLGVWVELTAGLTGVGEFNEGKLISESVTGSAPLVLATAVIDVTGSPMDGETIRLLNTERRHLRPGSEGTLQNHAFQGHRHNMRLSNGSEDTYLNISAGPSTGSGGVSTTLQTASGLGVGAEIAGSLGTPLTASETRVKNIGVRVFRRIG